MTDHGIVLAGALIAFGLAIGLGAIGAAFGDGLAGNASHRTVLYLYQHARDFFDVIRGNDVLGATPQQACGDDYLCTAKRGYDGPAGLGTPDGLGAF